MGNKSLFNGIDGIKSTLEEKDNAVKVLVETIRLAKEDLVSLNKELDEALENSRLDQYTEIQAKINSGKAFIQSQEKKIDQYNNNPLYA